MYGCEDIKTIGAIMLGLLIMSMFMFVTVLGPSITS
jgi:hypothetical protein